jgi:hypothetical protein
VPSEAHTQAVVEAPKLGQLLAELVDRPQTHDRIAEARVNTNRLRREQHVVGKSSQVGDVILGEHRACPSNCRASVGTTVIGLQLSDGHQVVVTLDAADLLGAYERERFAREGVVPDEIAEAHELSNGVPSDVGDHCPERRVISVDVRDDRRSHVDTGGGCAAICGVAPMQHVCTRGLDAHNARQVERGMRLAPRRSLCARCIGLRF